MPNNVAAKYGMHDSKQGCSTYTYLYLLVLHNSQPWWLDLGTVPTQHKGPWTQAVSLLASSKPWNSISGWGLPVACELVSWWCKRQSGQFAMRPPRLALARTPSHHLHLHHFLPGWPRHWSGIFCLVATGLAGSSIALRRLLVLARVDI